MSENMKISLSQTEWENAEAMMEWLANIAPEQQREMLSFLHGVAVGRMLATDPEPDEKKAG